MNRVGEIKSLAELNRMGVRSEDLTDEVKELGIEES